MTSCPLNCPNRTLHCHSTCQQYLRMRIMRLLTYKKGMQVMDKAGFYADVKENILRRKQREEKGRRIR